MATAALRCRGLVAATAAAGRRGAVRRAHQRPGGVAARRLTTCLASGWAAAPVCALQGTMEALHVYGHLPWWAAIAATATLVRVLTFPLVVEQQRRAARLEVDATPYIVAWRDKLAIDLRAKFRREDRPFEEFQSALTKEFRKKRAEIYRQHRCHPASVLFLPLAAAPLWVAYYVALRQMTLAAATHASLVTTVPLPADAVGVFSGFLTGGLPWCPNLVLADPTWILPGLAGASMFVTQEVRACRRRSGQRGAAHAWPARRLGEWWWW